MVRFCGTMEYKFSRPIIVVKRGSLTVSINIRTMHPYRSGRISFAKRQRDMVCRCLVE